MMRRTFLQFLGGLFAWPWASQTAPEMTVEVLYASKGEHIICENGHVIATMARDVKWGEFFKSSDIVDWQQSEPEIGTLEENCRCEKCGGAWFRRGTAFHFLEGWREA